MRRLYVGMDVHKDSVMMAVYEGEAREAKWVRRFPNEHSKLRKIFGRLSREGEIRACYEASGAGYVLQRAMKEWGYDCEIVAPSLIPKRPGDRRKHDKKDATELATLYRAGQLVTIRIPDEAQERVRDLVRCRATFQKGVIQSRHYILKFLTRRGLTYRQGTHWTHKHWAWLTQLRTNGSLEGVDQVIANEYFALLEYQRSRRDELDRKIEALALSPAYKEAVERLCTFRGFKTQAAMVLVTEIGDFRRFDSPLKLMAYLGLVPSEHSTGTQRRLGSITKAGNRRCRHVLVQAAWSYQYPPRVGAPLSRRQEGQAPDVIAHSWKAQHRLHTLFRNIKHRKHSRIAVVAVARELVGFLWAVMQDVEPAILNTLESAA